MKQHRKLVTMQEYSQFVDKIIATKAPVADTLMLISDYGAKVAIKELLCKRKSRKSGR